MSKVKLVKITSPDTGNKLRILYDSEAKSCAVKQIYTDGTCLYGEIDTVHVDKYFIDSGITEAVEALPYMSRVDLLKELFDTFKDSNHISNHIEGEPSEYKH